MSIAVEATWSGNGHQYQVVSVPSGITWTAARTAAEQTGGYLATIGSSDENNFIIDMLSSTPNIWDQRWVDHFGPWLGAYQDSGNIPFSSGWHWVTSEPFNWTSWYQGEPNGDNGTGPDYLHYFQVSQDSFRVWWNDVHNNGHFNSVTGQQAIPRGYIVEYETNGHVATGGTPDDER